ncbi:hypothetical protein DPX16_15521 [Anabarilius grahami]|uniref:Uncharacterized protein n=1 Tax=Anabarilius grahami TaxID=495550 RepID=A0A3N0XCM1_ANAGA|nr:hypothetical protein DPX16_15521 [Anabarilius grahami]
MGLFIVSEIPAFPMPPKRVTASDRLVGFRQDGRSLESRCNLILFLNCSEFVIEEVLDRSYDPRPVTPETQAAWPVRQSSFSSAYPSSEHSPDVLLDPKPRMANEKSSAGPRWSKRKRKKAAKQPQSPEFSASVQPQSPELSASVQPQSPEFSASVQPQSPEFSAAEQPKALAIEEGDWLIDFWAEPAPSPLDLTPCFAEPAPCFTEPAPSFHESAPLRASPSQLRASTSPLHASMSPLQPPPSPLAQLTSPIQPVSPLLSTSPP